MATSCSILYLDQHRFRQWLGAWGHQAIAWTNVSLYINHNLIAFTPIAFNSRQLHKWFSSYQSLRCVWKCARLKLSPPLPGPNELTCWCRVTHICIGNLTIIGSGKGLLPGRRQAIIWPIAEILLIGPLGTNFSEVFIEIHTFSLKEMPLKLSSAKWEPFCLGLNVLSHTSTVPCFYHSCC